MAPEKQKPVPTDTNLVKTANINVAPYSNLMYPYHNVEDLNKDEIQKEIAFQKDVLGESETSKDTATPKESKKAAKVEAPDNVVVITECSKCKSTNLEFKTGTKKDKSGPWYAYDCVDCKARNWTKVDAKPVASDIPDIPEDLDDDIPF